MFHAKNASFANDYMIMVQVQFYRCIYSITNWNCLSLSKNVLYNCSFEYYLKKFRMSCKRRVFGGGCRINYKMDIDFFFDIMASTFIASILLLFVAFHIVFIPDFKVDIVAEFFFFVLKKMNDPLVLLENSQSSISEIHSDPKNPPNHGFGNSKVSIHILLDSIIISRIDPHQIQGRNLMINMTLVILRIGIVPFRMSSEISGRTNEILSNEIVLKISSVVHQMISRRIETTFWTVQMIRDETISHQKFSRTTSYEGRTNLDEI